jgi:formate-dependent nitrite reductase cytochrome c552 subunit
MKTWADDPKPIHVPKSKGVFKLYSGSKIITPSGRLLILLSDRQAYPEHKHQEVLAELARARNLEGYYKQQEAILRRLAASHKAQLEFLEASLRERDKWVAQEKRNAEHYKAMMLEIWKSNRRLQKRWPNLPKILATTLLINEVGSRVLNRTIGPK